LIAERPAFTGRWKRIPAPLHWPIWFFFQALLRNTFLWSGIRILRPPKSLTTGGPLFGHVLPSSWTFRSIPPSRFDSSFLRDRFFFFFLVCFLSSVCIDEEPHSEPMSACLCLGSPFFSFATFFFIQSARAASGLWLRSPEQVAQ